MKIYRFSYDGFVPQYQEHHYEYLEAFIHDDDYFADLIAACDGNSYMEKLLYDQRTRKREFFDTEGCIEDIKYGIWVFTSLDIDPMSLNHLDIVPPLWEADISDDAFGYDVDLRMISKISDIPGADCVGCFVPESEMMSISNIREVDSAYEGCPYDSFVKCFRTNRM